MIYVVTPLHNAKKHVEAFAKSLHAQTAKDIVLVIVDDGSSNGGGLWLWLDYKRSIYLATKEKYWGGCLQTAYEYLKPRIHKEDRVLLINIDRTFPKDYISTALKYVKDGIMLVSTGLDEKGKWISGGLWVDWYRFSFEVFPFPNIAGTTGLFMTGKDFHNSGGFCKWLRHHWADSEFVWRQRMKGLLLITTPKVWITINTKSHSITKPKNLRQLFDIRCSQNPFAKSIFILKCCPLKYIPINLARAWYWVWRVL
jgi:GT2 family glycosyltransferase